MTTGRTWARNMPDEVLLVQTWLSARAAVDFLNAPKPNTAAINEVRHLTAEVKRRGLQAAMLPAGRALRGM